MKHTLLTIVTLFCIESTFAQGSWMRKADFPGAARDDAAGFSIGKKAYVGTGTGGSLYYRDLWEYDPGTNTWTQRANFGGAARRGAVGFSIAGKGYIGTGEDDHFNLRSDFWEYNPASNSWTRKATFGGTTRVHAVGFVIGGKGYIGTGRDDKPPLADTKDFWEYNPKTNQWTRKADFGGDVRSRATAFAIGTKGYIGIGVHITLDEESYVDKSDFWEYNPATDSWTRKADFGGGEWFDAVGFSIDGKGYIGTGVQGDCCGGTFRKSFWAYNPLTDKWTQVARIGTFMRLGVGLSIGRKGYAGLGGNEWWQYSTSSAQTMLDGDIQSDGMSISSAGLICYPIPSNGNITIQKSINSPGSIELIVHDTKGRIVYCNSEIAVKGINTYHINLSKLVSGTYYLQLKNGNEKSERKIVLTTK